MRAKFILLSSAVVISAAANAQHNVSTNGTRYSLLFEGTGAWCQHCSDGAVYVEKALDAIPKALAVSVHDADGMATPEGDAINTAWASGFPYGAVDGFKFTGEAKVGINRGKWQTKLNERLALPIEFDITMSHFYKKESRELTVVVTAKALKAVTGNYNINVYLSEDEVVGPNSTNYSQVNAPTYNDSNANHKYYHANNSGSVYGGHAIKSFKHMQVLRAMLGGTWGEAAFSNSPINTEITKTFTYVIPEKYGPATPATDQLVAKLDKMKLVAVVQKSQAEVAASVQAKVLAWNPNEVAEVTNFAGVELYPNPANNFVSFKAYLNTPAETKVDVVSAVGQTVISKTYPAGGSLLHENIELGNLSNGMYFIHLTSGGTKHVEKLMVNR